MSLRVAVVGAGLAGVCLARQLGDVAEVRVFEKSRGLGGRMATRRADSFGFDHGAQFFTARSDEFRALLGGLDDSVVVPWQAKVVTLEKGKKPFKREWFEDHFVALPQMNALVKALAAGLDIMQQCRVGAVERDGELWRLLDDQGNELGEYDWVISSAPAPQALELIPPDFAHRESLRSVNFSPCYALMLGFDSPPKLNFDAALVRNEALEWIAVNSRKPGRQSDFSLLLHSNNHWARNQQEDDPETIARAMGESLLELTGVDAADADHSALHRWRYARVETDLEIDYLLDEENSLAACGDWCRGNRVEDAFLSGHRLGDKLRDLLSAA